MNLTDHFTEAEFTATQHRTLGNDLTKDLRPAAVETCQLLERIRTELARLAGKPVPIIITSGYRSKEVNAAVGGVGDSDHTRAQAADFIAPAFGTPYEVAAALAPLVSDLSIGQLIHEYGRWVHVSTRLPDKRINRIITYAKGKPVQVGIQPV